MKFTEAVQVALKHFSTTNEAKEVNREIVLHRKLRHPNVVQYIGLCTNADDLYIVMEYVPDGSLLEMLRATVIFISIDFVIKFDPKLI